MGLRVIDDAIPRERATAMPAKSRVEQWKIGKVEYWNRSKDYAIRLIHYSIIPVFHYSNTPFPLSCSRKSVNLRWLAIDQRAMAAFDVGLDLASLAWLDPSDIFRLNKTRSAGGVYWLVQEQDRREQA
jgi:hypothetical protein